MSETKKRFKFSKAYPSDHLREPDLEGNEVTLTIKDWEYPNAEKDKGSDGKVMKGTVILVEESEKRFVANVTNFNAIASLYGRDPNKWIGQKVTLKPDKTSFGREKNMPCIRIKNIDPQTGKAPQAW